MPAIDHVTVAGTDLRAMQAALAAAGIHSVFGGAHRDGATEMAVASFPDGSYIELIAVKPDAVPEVIAGHPWERFLTGNAGPCAWAAGVHDLAGELRRLSEAGIRVSPPVANGRIRPDGVELKWETATTGEGPLGSFLPFLIQDFTPRELRVFPRGKPESLQYRGVARVVLGVRNLNAAAARYGQAYRLTFENPRADLELGARLAVLSGAPIVLAEPLDAGSWLAARLEQFGEAPCAVLLESGARENSRRGHPIRWLDSGRLGWRLGLWESASNRAINP